MRSSYLPATRGRRRRGPRRRGRIRQARFPARKSLEEFDYDHARSLNAESIAHLATLNFMLAKKSVVFAGPPAPASHLAIGLGIRACQAGRRVLFATATKWVARLADAHTTGRLQPALVRLAGVRCRGTSLLIPPGLP